MLDGLEPGMKLPAKTSRIFVAGHRGLVGSALVRKLCEDGFSNLVLRDRHQLDLRDQAATSNFFSSERPEFVFLAAARVGGIKANSDRPAEFLYENIAIQTNVIHAAWSSGVTKLLFLGSSCIYPKFSPMPIKEDALLTGPLEPTNEAYAVAKIAGLKMAQCYRSQYGFRAISLMPTNLYGPGDNFELASSHVLPALIRKIDDAKAAHSQQVTLWGTGSPRREFLHVDDLAAAAVFAMDRYEEVEPLNVGTGEDLSIQELAQCVSDIVGFRGSIVFDSSYPDGTPRKVLDVSRINRLGWKARIPLRKGIESTYQWYRTNVRVNLDACAEPMTTR